MNNWFNRLLLCLALGIWAAVLFNALWTAGLWIGDKIYQPEPIQARKSDRLSPKELTWPR